MLIKSGVTCQCHKCKALITTGDFKYTYRKKIFCFECGMNNSKKGKSMANKPANAAQKKLMVDIADWSLNNIHKLYGDEYMFCQFQLHHVLGRSAKNNKTPIGHEFILPIPFELHDVSSNHTENVTHCKKAFVRRFGTQRKLYKTMYQDMKEQGYDVPNNSIFSAIMGTSA